MPSNSPHVNTPEFIAAVESLCENFRGHLILSGDEQYDSARQLWNRMFDRMPALPSAKNNWPKVAVAAFLTWGICKKGRFKNLLLTTTVKATR
jgi:hypothetical protein